MFTENAEMEGYFNSVQDAIKNILYSDKYKVPSDEVEKFTQGMIVDNTDRQYAIKELVRDYHDRQKSVEEAAQVIIDKYFTKQAINTAEKIPNLSTSDQDVPNQLMGENLITNIKDFKKRR